MEKQGREKELFEDFITDLENSIREDKKVIKEIMAVRSLLPAVPSLICLDMLRPLPVLLYEIHSSSMF